VKLFQIEEPEGAPLAAEEREGEGADDDADGIREPARQAGNGAFD